jgi:hypothetical protein
MVTASEGIAIAEICIYSPIFILTLITLFRHGIKRQSGWIYLAIFCLVRIAGALFEVETTKHPRDVTDAEWAAILQSVGLSPLLLASFGLLKRVIDLVSHHVRSDPEAGPNIAIAGGRVGKMISNRATATSRRSRIIQLSQVPIVLALILCIIGGRDIFSGTASEATRGLTLTKVGIVIFLLGYVLLAALSALTVRDVSGAPSGEKRLYGVIVAAIPLLGIRLLWSMLTVFLNSGKFALKDENPWVKLGMAVIEEFLIVFMYTIVGLTLGKTVE